MSTTMTGLFGAPVTPFTADAEKVDLATFETLVDFMIREGNDGLLVNMHIGESLNLTIDERKELTAAAVVTAGGRAPIYVHVSMPGTAATVDLARHAESVGAAGVVAITPYHWQNSPTALVKHFAAVANSVGIHMLAYNYPERLGVTVTTGIIESMINTCENFVGVKTADLHMEYFTEICRVGSSLRPGFSVFPGVEYALPAIVLGGAGTFAACGSIAPRLVRDLVDACWAKDYDRARALQYKASRLFTALKPTYPARFKAALALMGRDCGPPRAPFEGLRDDEETALQEELAAIGITEDEPFGW